MSLAVEHLVFGYPGKQIGQDVSFALAAGEILCLLGPNGGGKTTLFRTALGLLPPQGGRVTLDGADIATRSRTEMAQTIGYVPQAQSGYFPFAVRDIVLMGRTARLGLFATPSAHDRRAAEQALATLGVAHLADQAYTRISGGERQLVLIARALAQEPKFLVMDEPTASLDFGNQLRVLDRIRSLAGGGIGVLLSTHDPDHAFLIANRVAMLHAGRLARLGPPEEAITTESLELLYGVDVRIVELGLDPEGRTRRVCIPALQGR
jgi:iron complex transport system ATP-binding protein